MIPIAGVLLLIIVVFTVAVVVSNPGIFNLSIFGAGIPVTTAGVYFTGAGAMLVLILAAALLRRGLKREMTRRKHVRALQNAAGVKRLPTSGPGAKSSPAAPASAPAPASASGRERVREPAPQARDTEPVSTGTEPVSTGTATAAAPRTSPDFRRTTEPSNSNDAPEASAAERQALLDEAEELTGDGADR